jgi:NAD(P)-dependent dehydrogenase (short-subunit alcohol dehydrogenase family)
MSEQPVAIVTGAARGIGAATALVLAERGYRLALVDRERADLEAVCVDAAKFKVDVLPLPGDLADLTFAESVVQATVERWGRIDLLVNNAAWRELATMRTISVESWEKTLRIGLTTPAFMARWAAMHMETRRSGVIVNISSIMAEQVGGISSAYVASKGGLSSLTYELASLYGPCGIRVVGICPGAIDTELGRDLSGERGQASDPLRGFSEDMIMLRRWGIPGEIAKAVAWVASDEAAYITGTNLVIDGGWRHQHFPHSLKRQQFPQEYGE